MKKQFIQETGLIIFFAWIFVCLPLIKLQQTIDPGLAARFLLTTIPLSLVWLYLFFKKPASILLSGNFLMTILILLLILLWMSISALRSVNTADSLWEFLRIANLFLFFLFAFIIVQNRKSLEYISRFSLLAIGIFSVYGILQLFPIVKEALEKNVPIRIDLRIGSSLGNKNLFSEIMLMFFPLMAYNVYSHKGYWKYIFIAGLLLSLFWIITLQYLAVWIALLISTLCIPLLAGINFKYFRRSISLLKLKPGNWILIFIIAIVTMASFAALRKEVFRIVENKSEMALRYYKNPQLIDSTSRMNDNSVFERILLWRNSIRMIRDYPVAGAGLCNWKLLQTQYGIGGTPFINTGMVHFEHPHNDYLLVMSEQGIPGLLLYISFFVFLLLVIKRAIKNAKVESIKQFHIWMGFAICSFAVLSFFGFPFSRFYIVMLLLLYTSLILVNAGDEFRSLKISKSSFMILTLIFFCVSLGGAYAAWSRLKGEIHTVEMLKAQYSKNFARMEREASKAESHFYRIDLTATPLSWYKGVAHFYSEDIKGATDYFEAAEKMNPYHLRILNDLATCYEKSGDHDKAIEKYKTSLKVAPFFTEGLLNLSATYYNTGQLDSALAVIKRVETVKISHREKTNYQVYLKAILSSIGFNYLDSIYNDPDSQKLRMEIDKMDLVEKFQESNRDKEMFLKSLKAEWTGSKD